MTETLLQEQKNYPFFFHGVSPSLCTKKKEGPSSLEEAATHFLRETKDGLIRFAEEENARRAVLAGEAIDVLLKSKNPLPFIPAIYEFVSFLQMFSQVAERNEHTMYFSEAQNAIAKNKASVVAKLEKNEGNLSPFYQELWTQSLWNTYENPSHQRSVVQTVVSGLTRAMWALSAPSTSDIFLSAFEDVDKNKSFVSVAEKYITFLSEPNLIYPEKARNISAEALAAGKKESEAIRNASKAKGETGLSKDALKRLRKIGLLCAEIDRLTPHKSPELPKTFWSNTVSRNRKTPRPS